jgi:ABC-2 type transport system permease protein
MKMVQFFRAIVGLALRQQMAFRLDFVFSLLVSGAAVASGLAALGIVYAHTETLGGWPRGEAIVLLGTFQLITALLNTFVAPNLQWFGDQVKNGTLDDALLKPMPSLVTASLGSCRPFELVNVTLGVATVVVGLRDLGRMPSVMDVAGYAALLGVAMLVTWAVRVLAACVTLWFPSVSLDVIFTSAWEFARYPVTIYADPVPFVLTYLVPVAFVSTVPAQGLARGVDLGQLVMGLCAAVGSAVVVWATWEAGLRRYVSATS